MNQPQKRDPARMVAHAKPDPEIFTELKRRFTGTMKSGKFHSMLVEAGLVAQARNAGGRIVLKSPTGATAHIPATNAPMSPIAMQNVAKQLLRPQ